MKYAAGDVKYRQLNKPPGGLGQKCEPLTPACYEARLEKFRACMDDEGLDAVAIYADREHYSNFKYFVGFEPRFEEGLLLIFKNGESGLLLGNECYPMHYLAQLPVNPVLCQVFSLPGQIMDQPVPLGTLLKQGGLRPGIKIGVIGWKLFTTIYAPNPEHIFDVPDFIMQALVEVVGIDHIRNITPLLINPNDGLRIINGADEIALYEYGASWASNGVAKAVENATPGMSEQELAEYLVTRGMQQSCHPMLSAGPNVKKGLVSPSGYTIQLGDGINVSLGLEGGLTCRGGYIASDIGELPAGQQGYIDALAKPYYAAMASWYSTVGIGVLCGEVYAVVDSIIPKTKFGWVLNPGHLIATEEWLTTDIREGSYTMLKSGMVIQMDIIPSVAPYACINAEDGVCLADANLRKAIQMGFPETWDRIQARRDYMIGELGIELKPEVLPLSNMTGVYNPLFMRKGFGFSLKD